MKMNRNLTAISKEHAAIDLNKVSTLSKKYFCENHDTFIQLLNITSTCATSKIVSVICSILIAIIEGLSKNICTEKIAQSISFPNE